MPRYIFFRASDGQAISGKSVAALLPQTAFTFGMSLKKHCHFPIVIALRDFTVHSTLGTE